MPIRRSCARCGAPFDPRHARHRWCDICAPKAEDRSPTTRTRPSSSTERESIRQAVLARDPFCTIRGPGCTGPSEVADHIVTAEHGGRYELPNLRGACHHCNSVRGGLRPSALKDGHADHKSGPPAAGGGGPLPVVVYGPTRLA